MQKLFITALACLISFSVASQTVYTEDQVVQNNDSTLHLDKSNNLPITGIVKGYYENGILSYEDVYKDGKLEGLCSRWHENGQLHGETNWKNGEANGLVKGYYENGQLKIEATFKDGKEDGLRKDYHDNGQLSAESVYKNGRYKARYSICYDESGNVIPCE